MTDRPDDLTAVLEASPLAVRVPPPADGPRPRCRTTGTVRCPRAATWDVDGVQLCALDAYRAVKATAGRDADAFTEQDRAMLDFEGGTWWRTQGAKDAAVREAFGVSRTRYEQRLLHLSRLPEAVAYAPMVCSRIARRVEARRSRDAAYAAQRASRTLMGPGSERRGA